jgi:hypothetical protein
MAHTVIVHIQGEEPVLGEMEEIPTPSDVTIRVDHPRRIDGKDLSYVADNVTTVIWPISRINFIEIMPTREEEEIIGFYRE